MTGSRCHSLDWQSDVVFLKSSFRVEIYGKDLVSGASQSLISEDCSQKKKVFKYVIGFHTGMQAKLLECRVTKVILSCIQNSIERPSDLRRL